MPATSAIQCFDRPRLIRELEATEYDLLVIGGGITGAGIARDAAMRGLKVALLEAQDFASGTSSRSSKMIHGGLRYLLKGDIPVVKESVSEREILHNIAPHLAEKSHYVITTRSLFNSIVLRTALRIYEFFGNVERQDRHKVWSLSELKQREPLLNTEGVYDALVYIEYLTDDARLTLATIRSAIQAGAVALNYMKVTDISKTKVFNVTAKSQLPEDDSQLVVNAKMVINAAGPWVDQLCRLENQHQKDRLALSRGIHLVVPRARLPLNHTMVMTAADKRIVFAVPGRETTYLGTTDEFYPRNDYWPDIYQKDIDYLLATTNSYFPSTKLTTKDITSVWSGIRPLIGTKDTKATEISRKDEVWIGPMGMLSIAGGKLSAYRAMAERVVDNIVKLGGFSAKPCSTAEQQLPGGGQTNTAPFRTLSPRLLKLYGSEAHIVNQLGKGLDAEVRFAVLIEGAVRLEDYWARRSSRAWFDTDAGMSALEPASQIMKQLLGWSETRRQQEIDHCIAINASTRQYFHREE